MKYAKALVAAGIAFCGALGTALIDNAVTTGEWVGVAAATLGALAFVWGVPNKAA